MSSTFKKYLRPGFTERLYRALDRGSAINLIAESGQGSRRLLEDLKIQAGKNKLLLIVNMRNYKENYQGFIEEIWRQLPDPLPNQFTNFAEVMTYLEKRKIDSGLLLYQFDALFNNNKLDRCFDESFFDNLNSFRNRKWASLCCVTNQPHNNYIVIIDQISYGNSWLELQREDLTRLTREEIGAEFKRRRLGLKDNQLGKLIEATYKQHTNTYIILDKIANNFKFKVNEDLSLDERIEIWTKTTHSFHDKFNLANLNRLFRPLTAFIIVFLGGSRGILLKVIPFKKMIDKIIENKKQRKGKDAS